MVSCCACCGVDAIGVVCCVGVVVSVSVRCVAVRCGVVWCLRVCVLLLCCGVLLLCSVCWCCVGVFMVGVVVLL